MGSPVMVELEGQTDPLQIAMKELKWVIKIKKTHKNWCVYSSPYVQDRTQVSYKKKTTQKLMCVQLSLRPR